LNIAEIVSELKTERIRIEGAISALEGLSHNGSTSRVRQNETPAVARKRGHHLSAEGRRRLSELMKKRWAERRKRASVKK